MTKDNYREKFFGKHTKRLFSDYELFLESIVEKQDELLSECVEFLYNDDLIDRIVKRQ